MNRFIRSGLGVTVAAAISVPLLSATPALAAAQTDPTPSAAGQTLLVRIQTNSNTEIDLRLAALHAAISAVAGNQAITAADKATLTTTLTNDESGLSALRQKIDADTTVTQATADHEQIFTTYRVYALALPQVHFAAAADDITGTVLPAVTAAQGKLQSLLTGADAAKNAPAVQATMTDLGNQIATINSSTSGLAATVLGFTPEDYNANHALLTPSRAQLEQARTAIKAARADIVSVMAALK
jgi:hypothetical protein